MDALSTLNPGPPAAYAKARRVAAKVSVPELPIPGDCQCRKQQQGNNFFRV